MDQVTGMAPPKKGNGDGWARLPSLSLPSYAFQWSRSYASSTSVSDYREVEEALGFRPAECHMFSDEYQMHIWKAGEIVPAGTYVRIDDRSYRTIILDSSGPLPA